MTTVHAVVLTLLVGAMSVQQETPPRLIVQVVEPGWHPAPGIDVSVNKVASCKTTKPSAVGNTVATDETGFARFEVADDASYRITIRHDGGFAADPVCVRLFGKSPRSPTAYVQIRVRLAGKSISTHK